MNATVRYASGRSEEIPLGRFHHQPGRISLDEARVTLHLQTEKGTWTRELWVPNGRSATVTIDPDSPRAMSGVEGRHPGLAFLLAVPTLLGLVLIVEALVWSVKASLGAAALTRGLLTCWMIVDGGLILFALLNVPLGFGIVLLTLWLWFLRTLVSSWIRAEEGPREPFLLDESILKEPQ